MSTGHLITTYFPTGSRVKISHSQLCPVLVFLSAISRLLFHNQPLTFEQHQKSLKLDFLKLKSRYNSLKFKRNLLQFPLFLPLWTINAVQPFLMWKNWRDWAIIQKIVSSILFVSIFAGLFCKMHGFWYNIFYAGRLIEGPLKSKRAVNGIFYWKF